MKRPNAMMASPVNIISNPIASDMNTRLLSSINHQPDTETATSLRSDPEHVAGTVASKLNYRCNSVVPRDDLATLTQSIASFDPQLFRKIDGSSIRNKSSRLKFDVVATLTLLPKRSSVRF